MMTFLVFSHYFSWLTNCDICWTLPAALVFMGVVDFIVIMLLCLLLIDFLLYLLSFVHVLKSLFFPPPQRFMLMLKTAVWATSGRLIDQINPPEFHDHITSNFTGNRQSFSETFSEIDQLDFKCASKYQMLSCVFICLHKLNKESF